LADNRSRAPIDVFAEDSNKQDGGSIMSEKSQITNRRRIAIKRHPAPVFRILVDTCVWLDLVKDAHPQVQLDALEQLIQLKRVALIVPRTVLDEFARNKTRVIEESRRSLSSTLKRVKEVVDKLGDPKKKRLVLDHLNEVDHKLPTLGENAVESVSRIEKLFRTAAVVEISDAVKLRASQRAIECKAPFHGQKNSIGDAILIETYADHALEKNTSGMRFMFVTHNIKDFSATSTNNKLPHPDIAACFSRVKSQYCITLAEALQRVAPELISDLKVEHHWTEQPRRLSEILDAMDLLFHQVWYNRHKNLRYKIETGKEKLIDREPGPFKYRKGTTVRDVWKGALKAAARVEKKYGSDNLGPWSDFEWGMINGKLSALRWILGDDWDMLDT
jgi:hypothetical protein